MLNLIWALGIYNAMLPAIATFQQRRKYINGVSVHTKATPSFSPIQRFNGQVGVRFGVRFGKIALAIRASVRLFLKENLKWLDIKSAKPEPAAAEPASWRILSRSASTNFIV